MRGKKGRRVLFFKLGGHQKRSYGLSSCSTPNGFGGMVILKGSDSPPMYVQLQYHTLDETEKKPGKEKTPSLTQKVEKMMMTALLALGANTACCSLLQVHYPLLHPHCLLLDSDFIQNVFVIYRRKCHLEGKNLCHGIHTYVPTYNACNPSLDNLAVRRKYLV